MKNHSKATTKRKISVITIGYVKHQFEFEHEKGCSYSNFKIKIAIDTTRTLVQFSSVRAM